MTPITITDIHSGKRYDLLEGLAELALEDSSIINSGIGKLRNTWLRISANGQLSIEVEYETIPFSQVKTGYVRLDLTRFTLSNPLQDKVKEVLLSQYEPNAASQGVENPDVLAANSLIQHIASALNIQLTDLSK